MSLFQKFTMNTQGVDYICSDIHGHFSLLSSRLDKIGFDKKVDRLFCLGDLIDRGPESERALEWLAESWFYAIQGNHERMLINAVDQSSPQLFMQWHAWGGSWAEDLTAERLDLYYKAFSSLPVAIELNLTNGKKVGLVHAELPDECDWEDVKRTLCESDQVNIEKDLLISDLLWLKSQIYRSPEASEFIEKVKNIDHVFHGHTIVDSVTTITNRTFMDLGSYLNDDIGLLNPIDFLSAE